MTQYRSVRGMDDLLPQDAWIWHRIEGDARSEFESAGYSEIRTPILEETAVFVRSVGETSDIVTKEMFTFLDRKERSLTMRPEGTAPIVRAYIEHGLLNISQVTRLYYVGPMFRAERPQKGRLRQFHQVGAEVIGSGSAYADIEAIKQANDLMKRFGLRDFTIKLNTLGCRNDKDKFGSTVREYLEGRRPDLCEDCNQRLDKNVLRVLDCKKESCRKITEGAPDVRDSLCSGCRAHFDMVKKALTECAVRFEEAKNLVRGLDYYTGTVFEITHGSLGGQDALGAGGRYDNLVKDMGGPDVPAVGYALGVERLIIALKAEGIAHDEDKTVFIASIGDEAKLLGIRLSYEIRQRLKSRPIRVVTDIAETSLKSQLRSADKHRANIVIMIGEDELKQGKATIKDMSGVSAQTTVCFDAIAAEMEKRLC